MVREEGQSRGSTCATAHTLSVPTLFDSLPRRDGHRFLAHAAMTLRRGEKALFHCRTAKAKGLIADNVPRGNGGSDDEAEGGGDGASRPREEGGEEGEEEEERGYELPPEEPELAFEVELLEVDFVADVTGDGTVLKRVMSPGEGTETPRSPWITLVDYTLTKVTTHHSPLTTHHSPLTTHHSPLTTHHSLTRHSLTTRHSPLATRHSPLTLAKEGGKAKIKRTDVEMRIGEGLDLPVPGIDSAVATMTKGERAIVTLKHTKKVRRGDEAEGGPPRWETTTYYCDIVLRTWYVESEVTDDGRVVKKVTKEAHEMEMDMPSDLDLVSFHFR